MTVVAMEESNDENITPLRRNLRPRVKKTPPPSNVSSTPGSRSARQRRYHGKEAAAAPFWKKASHQQGKVLSNITPAEREDVVSPQLDEMASANEVALPHISNRANHRNNGIAKYVITPHTPHTTQEQDVGFTLAALKSGDTPTSKPLSPNGYSYKLTFPETVHKLVMETNKTDPDLIHWILNGEAFVIREKDKKLSQVLKKHFRHGKYGSLQRQLNMYGWKKHMTGRFIGAFHNPAFHRDIPRAKLVRIMRRGPPARTSKIRSTKTRPSTLSDLADTHSDDEWKPGNNATTALNCVSLKGRPSRGAKKGGKKIVRKIWEASDSEAVEDSPSQASQIESDPQSRPKNRTSRAVNNRFLEVALSMKIPHQNETHVAAKDAVKVKSHAPSKNLTPNRRYGATPRKLSANLLYCEADDSPSEHWSPFFGGLMRQESVAAIKSVGLSHDVCTTSHKASDHNLARHSGENYWTHWNEIPPAGSAEVAWAPRADHCRKSVPHTRDISPFLSTNSGHVSHLREFTTVPARAMHDIAASSCIGEDRSPFGVWPGNFVPSMSRSLMTDPPMLSRESSATFPISLAQRVSSSFFLPFMGMTETLSYALELQPDSVPSTPTPAARNLSSFQPC